MRSDSPPFGMVMPNRSYAAGTYRFGFNGKENDNEVKGTANQQDYGLRIYDTRLGKFLSVDPITSKYPELTPFQFASNNPIQNIDLDGLEGVDAQTKQDGQTTSAVSSTYTGPVNDPTKTKPALEIVYKTPPNAMTDLKNKLNSPGSLGPYTEPTRWLGKVVYDIADEAKSLGSGLINGPNGATNLEGIGLSPKEYTDAGIHTLSFFGTIGLTAPESVVLRTVKSEEVIIKSLVEQADDLVKLNGGKNSVTLRTETQQIRYDLAGKDHGKIPTPHKQVYNKNFVNGVQKSIRRASKEAIPMTQQEIRLIRKWLERTIK